MGNQLFQLAAGKTLALKYQTSLLVDTHFLEANPQGLYTKRNYELNYFNLHIEKCPEPILRQIALQTSNNWFDKLLRKIPSNKTLYIYNENGPQFNLTFNELPDNTYLNGFWQSALYFKNCEQELRKELTIKNEFLTGIDNYLNKIQNSLSVSVHVRRGDYVNLKSANEFHGVCDLGYYQKAIEYINSNYEQAELFIFSDDIAWCKANLKAQNKLTYVETGVAIKDLYLMQHCKHNIIANSSFSWWGAWLNANNHKTVIAPKHWFNDSHINTTDLIPTNWIKL